MLTTIFTPVKTMEVTHEQVVKDLETASQWGYQWKMVFNLDTIKQVVEIIFMVKKTRHPDLRFYDIPAARNG